MRHCSHPGTRDGCSVSLQQGSRGCVSVDNFGRFGIPRVAVCFDAATCCAWYEREKQSAALVIKEVHRDD
jgi:hypothetical protein